MKNDPISNLKQGGAVLTEVALKKPPQEMTLSQLKHSQLLQYQGMPLSAKIRRTEILIHEAMEEYNGLMYIAFSGGKDSTVLSDIIKRLYPDIPMVFANTGNELDSVINFVETFGDEVTIVLPKMTFEQVVKKYGYPVISKMVSEYVNRVRRTKSESVRQRHLVGLNADGSSSPRSKISNKWQFLINAPFDVTNKCCGHLKNKPTAPYRKKTGRTAFVGTMASESAARLNSYVNHGGCNAFDQKEPVSRPLMFWTDQDILEYLKVRNVPYADCYGDIIEEDGQWKTTGENRTGCKFCLFGINYDGTPNRIQRLAVTEPESYKYCIEVLRYDKVMDFLGEDWRPYVPKIQQDLFDPKFNEEVFDV